MYFLKETNLLIFVPPDLGGLARAGLVEISTVIAGRRNECPLLFLLRWSLGGFSVKIELVLDDIFDPLVFDLSFTPQGLALFF